MMNETTVIMIIYHVFLFTEYVPNPDTRLQVGWSLIVVITINLSINTIIIVKDIIIDVI